MRVETFATSFIINARTYSKDGHAQLAKDIETLLKTHFDESNMSKITVSGIWFSKKDNVKQITIVKQPPSSDSSPIHIGIQLALLASEALRLKAKITNKAIIENSKYWRAADAIKKLVISYVEGCKSTTGYATNTDGLEDVNHASGD